MTARGYDTTPYAPQEIEMRWGWREHELKTNLTLACLHQEVSLSEKPPSGLFGLLRRKLAFAITQHSPARTVSAMAEYIYPTMMPQKKFLHFLSVQNSSSSCS